MDLKELREKRAAAIKRAEQLLEAEQLDQAAFDAALAEAADLAARIKGMEALAEQEAFNDAAGRATAGDADRRNVSLDQAQSEADGWLCAFGGWAAAQHPENIRPLSDQHRQLIISNAAAGITTTDDAKGGVAVLADGVNADIFYEVMRYHAPMLRLATVMRQERGNKAHVPGVNDTTNFGRIISEGSSRSKNAPAWVKSEYEFNMFDSDWLTLSYQALQDMHVRDLGGMLMRLASKRIARMLSYVSTRAVNGTAIVIGGDNKGTPKFDGLATAASTGLTTAANNAVVADEFIDFTDSLDPAYESGGERLMCRKSVVSRLRKMKDQEGRYLFRHERVFGERTSEGAFMEDAPARGVIDEVPYVLNNDLDDVAPGKTVALYGDLKAFVIMLAKQIRVSSFHDSQTANDLQVWFAGHARASAVLTDDNAVKKLVVKA